MLLTGMLTTVMLTTVMSTTDTSATIIPKHIYVGDQVTFKCNSTTTVMFNYVNGGYNIIGYNNEIMLNLRHHFSFNITSVSNVTVYELVLSNAQEHHSAYYSCIDDDGIGEILQTWKLIVTPSLTTVLTTTSETLTESLKALTLASKTLSAASNALVAASTALTTTMSTLTAASFIDRKKS